VNVYSFWPIEISWCVDTCLTEGWWWYSETNEIAVLRTKEAPRHVRSVLFCSKKHLISCVLCKYTQTSMKCLRAAYNNTYLIMHYIPRNVSVRLHQVSHRVTTFDALMRNNLYRFLPRCGYKWVSRLFALVPAAQQLISSSDNNICAAQWADNATKLRIFIPNTGTHPQNDHTKTSLGPA